MSLKRNTGALGGEFHVPWYSIDHRRQETHLFGIIMDETWLPEGEDINESSDCEYQYT